MPIFKFLHIAAMFLGVAFSIGGAWFFERVAATRDVAAIRTTIDATQPVSILINGFLGIRFLFGLVTTYFDQFNFLAPWLIASYLIFIILSALGGAVTGKWLGRIGTTLAKHSGNTPTPDLEEILDDPTPRRVFWINIIGIVILNYLMVFKPGGI